MSSNVSGFESLFRAAVCDPADLGIISALRNFPETEKPKIFQGQNIVFIENSVKKFIKYAETISPNGNAVNLVTNNNNQLGDDIEDTFSTNSFEIKLGGMTDANLGLGIMEWGLETNGQSEVTSSTTVAMPTHIVARWCGERGAQLLIDAAHAVGHVPVDVEPLLEAVRRALHNGR